MEKQTDGTKSEGSKTVVVKKWYWGLGLGLVVSWAVYELLLLQIFSIPVRIFEDPWSGSGYAIGCFAWLGAGIWLMIKGRKVIDKSND